MTAPLFGITLTHPWPRCIHSLGKDTENRTWHPSSKGGCVGMFLAIHGGVPPRLTGQSEKTLDFQADLRWVASHIVDRKHVTEEQMDGLYGSDGAERFWLESAAFLLPGIVAVARVSRVCRDSKSPWAARGQWHWHLEGVVPLATPLPYVGAQGLWRVSDARTFEQLRDAWAAAHDGEVPF